MKLPDELIDMEIETDNKRIVMYNPGCHIKNNIFCLDNNGEIVWQVSRVGELFDFIWLGKPYKEIVIRDPGRNRYYNPEGKIIAADLVHKIYEIDPHTGIAKWIGFGEI